LTGMFQG